EAHSLPVEASSSRTPRHLEVLLMRETPKLLAVPLLQRTETDGAHGKVDAHRKRLRRVHHAQDAPFEQPLTHPANSCDETGVVHADAARPQVLRCLQTGKLLPIEFQLLQRAFDQHSDRLAL